MTFGVTGALLVYFIFKVIERSNMKSFCFWAFTVHILKLYEILQTSHACDKKILETIEGEAYRTQNNKYMLKYICSIFYSEKVNKYKL